MNDELEYAEELVRALRCNRTNCIKEKCVFYKNPENAEDYTCFTDDIDSFAADLIEALTAENAELREAQRWIPVTEKPPEGDCFVYEASKKKMHFAYAEELDAPDWLVTHWCKLPDPPQKGNNDGNKTR